MAISYPIAWDETGKRMFETGVDHGVLYVMNASGTAYEAGVPWNGLTGVTASPDGAEPTDLWADNIKYATLRSAETFGMTIEAYTYPDEFAICDGSAVADTAGAVHIGQQSRRAFGFTYRTKVGSDTDTEASKYKIHVVYNCTASPSERSYETINDSPDAITFSWEVTTTPVAVGSNSGYKPTSEITIDVWKLTDANKKALEDKLYGTSSVDATLPDPATLIALIGGNSNPVVTE